MEERKHLPQMPYSISGRIWKKVTTAEGGDPAPGRSQERDVLLYAMSRYYLLETYEYTEFKLKTTKLEAKAMAGVVKPSREPHSRHLGEPSLDAPRMERPASRKKSTENTQDYPKQGRLHPPLAISRVARLLSPGSRAGPWGSHPHPHHFR